MNIQKIIGLTAFLLVALNMFVQTDAYSSSQWGSRTFHTGPRYGRGGRASAKKIFAPRNERFELGTRYGKRSNIDGEIPETLIYPKPPKSFFCGENEDLACSHTGVENIYRCNHSYGNEVDIKDRKD